MTTQIDPLKEARPALLSPPPGSLAVDPHVEMVITMPRMPLWQMKLKVCVGTEVAFDGGPSKGWALTRFWIQGGRLMVGMRKLGGLEPRNYLVQIEAAGARSMNQWFIVQGAHTLPPRGDKFKVIRVPGGFFWVSGSQWNLAGKTYETPSWYGEGEPVGVGCVLYRRLGMVAWIDASGVMHTDAVPMRTIGARASVKMAPATGGYILLSRDEDGSVLALWPDRMHVWSKAGASCIGLTRGWMHASVGDTSRHLQIEAVPAMADKTLDDWWDLSKDEDMDMLSGSWRMHWGDNIHVWHNSSELIAHVDPDPVRGVSDAVLWTSTDIGGPILSAQPIDDASVLVNESIILDVRDPVGIRSAT